jgi:hypothetical protein
MTKINIKGVIFIFTIQNAHKLQFGSWSFNYTYLVYAILGVYVSVWIFLSCFNPCLLREERESYKKKKGEIKGSVDHILTAKNIKLGINGFGFQMRV